MKSILIFCLVLTLASCIPRPSDQYTDKYDNVDVDEILQSDRLLKNYINCVLDKGRCTPAATELKKNLPDAIENGCSKCTETQRKVGEKVLKFLIEKKREYYDELEAKYDPEGKYLKRYEEDLKKSGIKL